MPEPSHRADLLTRFEQVTYWPLTILALVLVPIVLLPDLLDLPPRADAAFEVTSISIWIVFAVELVVRVSLARQRFRFLLKNWIDVLIVLIPLVGMMPVHHFAHFRAALGVARAAAAIARVTPLGRRIVDHRSTNFLVTSSTISIIVAGLLVYLTERGNPAASIGSFGDGLWWAVTTITTVGYGDAYPTTSAGRAVALTLMVVGIAIFSGITATVASVFSRDSHDTTQSDLQALREEIAALRVLLERQVGSTSTALAAGYDPDQDPAAKA